jgi:hypothetical protein
MATTTTTYVLLVNHDNLTDTRGGSGATDIISGSMTISLVEADNHANVLWLDTASTSPTDVAVPATGSVDLFPERTNARGQTPVYDWTAKASKDANGDATVAVNLNYGTAGGIGYKSTGYQTSFGFIAR